MWSEDYFIIDSALIFFEFSFTNFHRSLNWINHESEGHRRELGDSSVYIKLNVTFAALNHFFINPYLNNYQ